ncbi:actin-like ATPase involved in cell morphogenesis [Kibdelosporangium banguiense]|uniref:Actin-like ATPase involved in cell morphogenesis n=1 Tax=Kibdelosporangium banguiense TaxID=1365924 RepID=A0ABS4U303_9PSEU|nr:Hsp70 family protein [Kibdelosporangium banguiense]MBP2331050.1 actin-like ATPase involved in cell morphogenesis [Kibdelosporangium banguiense]
MRVLSVDLGTSNTVAVLSAHGRPPRVIEVDGSATMPSAVFAGEDGNLLVGRDAERRARLDPSRFEPNPKRRVDEGTLLLGDTVVPVTDALAAVLARVGEETQRQLGGAKPDEIRLTHPAQWGATRRNVLMAAARLAGLGSNLVLVPEPVAAAAHFASIPGQSLVPGKALAVYDLGAGTFDIAVVGATQNGFNVLAEDGLPDLGGLDVDQALLEHVGREVSHRDPGRWQRLLRPETTADRRAQRSLREDVKAAKEALSRHPQTEVPMPEPFDDVLVTRAELEALVRPNLLRSVELLAATIRSAGMTPDRLLGIYLVGGSSRMPLVATLIAEQLRVVPTSLDQPETAVALGAHHVPYEGISMRTQNVPSALSQDQPTATMAPVRPAYRPPTPASPSTGFPQPFPAPPLPSNFPSAQPPPKKPNRKILIGVAAAVVVVLAVVGLVIFLPSNGLPSAQDCASVGERDDKGFTACLRQLAGGVPDNNSCKPGVETSGLDANAGLTATCTLRDDYRVSYLQANSNEEADKQALGAIGSLGGDIVQADWKGNGLSGRYQAAVGGGTGKLVFLVAGRPILGVLSKGGLRDSDTPNEIADFWERNVQPGS